MYEDLVVDGVAVIKEGAIVKGSVSAARRAKRGGLGGNLKISIESTSTIDNQPIKLRTVKSQEGKNRIGAVLVTGIFIGPFALLKRGINAEISKGTKFQVYTDEQKIVHIGDKTSATKQDINIENDKKPDLYNELLKLKELKDKGVLTEEEFEVQKKKTLERY
ncbi:MAG: SHOCT domain-containing protein [Proteobacteria bacterium]|nr:SHOCT domain-containing protein [Pseudomonadota bacterium]